MTSKVYNLLLLLLLSCGACTTTIEIEPIANLEYSLSYTLLPTEHNKLWLLSEVEKGFQYQLGEGDPVLLDSLHYGKLLYADSGLMVTQDTFLAGEDTYSVRGISAWDQDGKMRWQRSLGKVLTKDRIQIIQGYLHLITEEHVLIDPATGATSNTRKYTRLGPLNRQGALLWLEAGSVLEEPFYWTAYQEKNDSTVVVEDTLLLPSYCKVAYDQNDSIAWFTARELDNLSYRPLLAFHKNTLQVVQEFQLPLALKKERHIFKAPNFHPYKDGFCVYNKGRSFFYYMDGEYEYQLIPFEEPIHHVWNQSTDLLYVLAGSSFYTLNPSTQEKNLLWTHKKDLKVGLVHSGYLYAVDGGGLFFRKKL